MQSNNLFVINNDPRIRPVFFPIKHHHWGCRIGAEMPAKTDILLYSYDYENGAAFVAACYELAAQLEKQRILGLDTEYDVAA